MLQLLLERGQSYGDIGSLLGLEVDEVRTRARAALTEIGGEDPDREVALTDYLLGQADPIGRADAARHLQADPQANALAQKLAAQLRLLAPGAELPSLPDAKGPAPAAAPKTAPAPQSGQDAPAAGGGLSSSQRRLIAALVGAGALVAVIVLLVTVVFSGGDDDNGGGKTTASNGSSDNGTTTGNPGTLTKAILQPEGGGSGSGVAIFGRVRNVPVLEVRAIDLEPSPKGSNYSIWLFRNDNVALRVGGVKVDDSGRILTQIPIPTQALGFVANGTFDTIVVTQTDDAEFAAEVAQAKKDKRLPKLTGDVVLRGEISGPAVQQAGAGGGSPSGGGNSGG
jgi:hypothetical protein